MPILRRQAAVVLGVLGSCLAVFPLGAQDARGFFPLAAGNRWTYVGKGPLVSGAKVEIRVESRDGDFAVLSIDPVPLCFLDNPGMFRVEDRVDEIDIEISGRGFVPYYRFREDTFTHNDLCTCDDRRVLEAASREDRVVTEAGEFTGCLRFDYAVATTCFDAGKLSEWWAPGVGLVQWEEQTFAGPGTFLLKSYDLAGDDPPFRRGDSNRDGKVDLSDPIDTLRHLFLESKEPPCRDAADADDNGILEITDPIVTLEFLFLGSEPLPEPGPRSCGPDPTEDALDCRADASCP